MRSRSSSDVATPTRHVVQCDIAVPGPTALGAAWRDAPVASSPEMSQPELDRATDLTTLDLLCQLEHVARQIISLGATSR
jgi:hypothetical protein